MIKTKCTVADLWDADDKFEEMSTKAPLSIVFHSGNESYINEFTLFVSQFNYIPNFVREIEIDCKKARQWFIDAYTSEIKKLYYSKTYFNESTKLEYDDLFYFLYDDLIVNFDTNRSIVRFLFQKTHIQKVDEIINEIHKYKKRRERSKPEISILINSADGIKTKSLNIIKPKLSIEDNYNADFFEIHQTIFKRLSKKNDKGLILLHGKPGTGKTSYIRYLITLLKKKIIFLPPNMAAAITSPGLISILLDNPNSIFVIEDAENIIVDRERNGSSSVSALLNISDGLLADCLNVQIICSFNTDLSKIDNIYS